MKWYERAAKAGNVEAQFALGVRLENSQHGQPDSAAFHWYLKAAEQGHVQAQYKLGLVYYQGKGVNKDLSKAAQWYEAAAGGSTTWP